MKNVVYLGLEPLKFSDDMPDYCPPHDADDPPCVVYRAVDGDEIADQDLKSWVEGGHPSANENDCRHWGISIWMCKEAVEHARDVVPHMQDKYVAEGNLIGGDGKVGATPTKRQPMHCTFWYAMDVDLKPRFKIVMEPVDV